MGTLACDLRAPGFDFIFTFLELSVVIVQEVLNLFFLCV